ncbi:ATP-dependent RNA helicase DHX33 [Caerostris extrusa]|uniref:ATP-dependent RNA helicase DHX33 n=1 Tax=Caerostris extrusa TaxID=172846 RepID=A0AAV4VKQ7_CAEEX|nr:ATP-dependent RNA helicase DHX33 [Caerostris extrusa]
MLLNIYKQFKKFKGNVPWCKENYINFRNMKKAMAIRKQLSELSAKIEVLGLFMNVALLHENNTYKLVESNQEIKVHPSSCLFKKRNLTCVIYTELVQTSNVFMVYVNSLSLIILVIN